MNFTIKKINDNGSVDVAFSDGKVQNLSNQPVHDENLLVDNLVDYAVAYERGLKQVEIEVSEGVDALVSKVIDVDAILAQREADRLQAIADAEEAQRLADEQAKKAQEEAEAQALANLVEEGVATVTPVEPEVVLGASQEANPLDAVSENPSEVLGVEPLPERVLTPEESQNVEDGLATIVPVSDMSTKEVAEETEEESPAPVVEETPTVVDTPEEVVDTPVESK